MGKTHQRNVSHVSLASTTASSAIALGGASRSWASYSCDSSSGEPELDLPTPLESPRAPPAQDVVVLVDKLAFATELDVPQATLKRFKTAAACTQWLEKRLRQGRADGRVVVIARESELAVLRSLVAARSTLVAGVIVVGGLGASVGAVPVREAADVDEAARCAADLLEATSARQLELEPPPQRPRLAPDTVWIDAAARESGACPAAAAIRTVERELKLWHQHCGECTTAWRCPRCNKASRGGGSKERNSPAWPWLGEQQRALVAAACAPVLGAHLARFAGLRGPYAEIALYGPASETTLAALRAGGAVVHAAPSLMEAAAALAPKTELTEDHSTEGPDSALSLSVCSDSDSYSDAGRSDYCPTPTPIDHDYPWLLDTAPDGRPLDAPVAIPALFAKPFGPTPCHILFRPATLAGPSPCAAPLGPASCQPGVLAAGPWGPSVASLGPAPVLLAWGLAACPTGAR